MLSTKCRQGRRNCCAASTSRFSGRNGSHLRPRGRALPGNGAHGGFHAIAHMLYAGCYHTAGAIPAGGRANKERVFLVAKIRMAGKKKTAAQRPGGAIPCIILVVTGIVLMSLLFYAILRTAS